MQSRSLELSNLPEELLLHTSYFLDNKTLASMEKPADFWICRNYCMINEQWWQFVADSVTLGQKVIRV